MLASTGPSDDPIETSSSCSDKTPLQYIYSFVARIDNKFFKRCMASEEYSLLIQHTSSTFEFTIWP